MNDTGTEEKYSQLPRKEGSMQNNSAEHKGYAGAYISERIPENNAANANEANKGILEKIQVTA